MEANVRCGEIGVKYELARRLGSSALRARLETQEHRGKASVLDFGTSLKIFH